MSGERSRRRRDAAPAERRETVRQMITSFLQGPPATVREISQAVRASERDVLEHMVHLERSLPPRGSVLAVTPAQCEGCGFVFRKRYRLRRPGRCPLCRSTAIVDPLFSIRRRGRARPER